MMLPGLPRVGLRISCSDIVSVGLRRADTQIPHHAGRGVRPSSRTEAESADTDMGDAAGLVPRRNSFMWTWPKRTNAARVGRYIRQDAVRESGAAAAYVGTRGVVDAPRL